MGFGSCWWLAVLFVVIHCGNALHNDPLLAPEQNIKNHIADVLIEDFIFKHVSNSLNVRHTLRTGVTQVDWDSGERTSPHHLVNHHVRTAQYPLLRFKGGWLSQSVRAVFTGVEPFFVGDGFHSDFL